MINCDIVVLRISRCNGRLFWRQNSLKTAAKVPRHRVTPVLAGVAIARRLSLVKSPVILVKGLRFYLVALGFTIIELKGSGRLGGCYFRLILMAGDYCSTLGTI